MFKLSAAVLGSAMFMTSSCVFAHVDAVIYGGTVLAVPGTPALKEQTLVLKEGKINLFHFLRKNIILQSPFLPFGFHFLYQISIFVGNVISLCSVIF